MPPVFVQRGPLAAELGAGSGRSRGRAAPVSLSCYSLIGGSDPAFQYWNSTHLAAKAGTGLPGDLSQRTVSMMLPAAEAGSKHLQTPCSTLRASFVAAAK